jgi:arylsulfatase
VDRRHSPHLDGYNQLDFVCGKSESARHEIVYFAESTVGAVRLNDYKYRFIDQPQGWLGSTVKPDWPILVNLRLDPFERTGLSGSLDFIEWYQYEFWRFVLVQDVRERFAKSFVDYPPMQEGATFNLDALKAQVQKAMLAHHGQ